MSDIFHGQESQCTWCQKYFSLLFQLKRRWIWDVLSKFGQKVMGFFIQWVYIIFHRRNPQHTPNTVFFFKVCPVYSVWHRNNFYNYYLVPYLGFSKTIKNNFAFYSKLCLKKISVDAIRRIFCRLLSFPLILFYPLPVQNICQQFSSKNFSTGNFVIKAYCETHCKGVLCAFQQSNHNLETELLLLT